jgi:hypothetical protein
VLIKDLFLLAVRALLAVRLEDPLVRCRALLPCWLGGGEEAEKLAGWQPPSSSSPSCLIPTVVYEVGTASK